MTRLILLHGDAGNVIHAFGSFVVGGNLVVGLVVFLILVVIQFVVITNGAGRVAEVAARFTLDAMPGKQMAIDADLNAGQITDERGPRAAASEIAREADFYGAMDGASKFVKGDAIAGILIVAINLLGGIDVGVLQQRHVALARPLHTFSLLTIGDGLAAQIPALLISTATGIIVTRSAQRGRPRPRHLGPDPAPAARADDRRRRHRRDGRSSRACRSSRSSSSAASSSLLGRAMVAQADRDRGDAGGQRRAEPAPAAAAGDAADRRARDRPARAHDRLRPRAARRRSSPAARCSPASASSAARSPPSSAS